MIQPLHLAIDTSASLPAVALMRGEQALSSWMGEGGLKHHETLLGGVDHCLKKGGFPLKDLAFLSIGVGPGLFTGLRIGMVTAKFLADPLNLPCVAVPSLLALALQSGEVGKGRVWALGDAKSRRVYALEVTELPPDFSSPPGEEVAISPEEAAQRMRSGDFLVGEGALLYKDLWPAGTRLLPESAHALKGETVGKVGARRYALALTCTATELEPKYLKTGQAHL
ncbi:MAG TPA: tRNA (adenosine(37)-N6)-threonylcarbamoyltransferase complex dimerization subunit type 1 TsaB [Bdellovibrionota bacterium]|jgi:tRNA threonylcarbamoyladenosine biosynthesis protein TsaB